VLAKKQLLALGVWLSAKREQVPVHFTRLLPVLAKGPNSKPMLLRKRKVQEEREMRNTTMQVQFSKTLGNRNRVSGFRRLFVLSLLTAAFACTTLHAQTVAYVVNESFASSSGTVSVIDTSTNTVTATIAVGTQPAGR
jgi:YVTN family beta-propeller protein